MKKATFYNFSLQITSVGSVTWQLCSFLRATSLSNDSKSCKRPESSSLGSVESLRRSIPDRSPIACRRGRYTLVDLCACLDTPPVASCQRLGGTVRQSATTPVLTRRLLPAARGYCSPVSCHAACRQLLGLMVTEGCTSFSTELRIVEGCALSTTDLKMVEKHVSGATELKMVGRHVSGTTGLMVAKSYASGTIEMTMAERSD
ncbi:hypothetical protein GW17_00059441 [Ensete ventricosum]|nr:hypothetical protein GW17_00059441 [Ensete ventricosum]